MSKRLFAIALFLSCGLHAATLIDFEGIGDFTPLTNQFAGVTFTNALILEAGISLNDIDFPPTSGTAVAFDNGGPLGLLFSTPVSDFSAFFTYSQALTINAYGTNMNLIGSTSSSGTSNRGLSEKISFQSSQAIKKIEIVGRSSGSSFIIDDATFSPANNVVPEPSHFVLLTAGVAAMLFRLRKGAAEKNL